MRKIILEKYSFGILDGEGKSVTVSTNDADTLKSPLNNMSVGGRTPVTVEILQKVDKICDKINEANKSKDKILLLEDDEYRFLKEKFNSYGNWASGEQIRKFILKAGEKLNKAEVYDPKENINKKDKNKKEKK